MFIWEMYFWYPHCQHKVIRRLLTGHNDIQVFSSTDCTGSTVSSKDLPHPTSEDIELRLCLSERTSNEDVVFEVVEVYVQ